VPEPQVITGSVRINHRGDVGPMRGVVRLEDVTTVDAPAQVLARASIFLAESDLQGHFRLEISESVDPDRSYMISAQLEGIDARTGQSRLFGTTAAHSWQPGKDRVDVELQPWN
jgi:uncharacterized lipoprotein YbaY